MDENITTTTPPYDHDKKDALKAVLLVTLFILTFLASVLPFALKRAALQTEPARRRRCFVTAFSMLSCFGGGVFLATCLLDLLPDSIESIEDGKQKMSLKISFPLAELLVCVGFFIVLTMEQMVMFAKEMSWIGGGELERLLGHDHEGLPGSLVDSQRRRTSEEPDTPPSATARRVPAADDQHFHPESHSTVRAVLLVCALSMHAVFEGLSMGMQSSVDVMLQVFIALCIHKALVGFSLGLRLVQSPLRAYV
uniref:Solute carrier family 39 member 1 n=1 Tax=Plectus sambesii TaxID=2011161 RepID=A0A914X3M8_9BILA